MTIKKTAAVFNMRKVLFLTISFCMLLPNLACAGEESGTVVFSLGQYNSNSTTAGYTFFVLENELKTNSPTCATASGGDRWVINNDWPAAKMQVNVLLTALISGKRVHVRGTGDCNVWGDTETAQDIFILNN